MTSHELANPPDWVTSEAKSGLADSHVVFIGIGDPASYIASGIEALIADAPAVITVVSPGLPAKWNETKWSEIHFEVAEDHRIDASAEEFLDVLAGAYIRRVLARIKQAVEGTPRREDAIRRVEESIFLESSVFMLLWFRAAAVPREQGPVVSSNTAAIAMMAIGCIGQNMPSFSDGARVEIDGNPYVVLIEQRINSASRMRREAKDRLAQYLSDGGNLDAAPRFLISSTFGIRPIEGPVRDVVGSRGLNDVIDGPLAAIPVIVDADRVVQDEQ